MTASALVLRAGAALVAASSFIGASAYVLHHPKNPAAPLQPPSTGELVLRVPASAAPVTTPPVPTASGRAPARPTARPPQITLQPGVRATALPGLTYTHVS